MLHLQYLNNTNVDEKTKGFFPSSLTWEDIGWEDGFLFWHWLMCSALHSAVLSPTTKEDWNDPKSSTTNLHSFPTHFFFVGRFPDWTSRLCEDSLWQKQEAAEGTPAWYLLTWKIQTALPQKARHVLNFRVFYLLCKMSLSPTTWQFLKW